MTRIAIPIFILLSGASAASEPQMVAKSVVFYAAPPLRMK